MENLNITVPRNIDGYIEGYDNEYLDKCRKLIFTVIKDLKRIENFYKFYTKIDSKIDIVFLEQTIKMIKKNLEDDQLAKKIILDCDYLKIFFTTSECIEGFETNDSEIVKLVEHSIYIKRDMKEICDYQERSIALYSWDWDYEYYKQIYIANNVTLNSFNALNNKLEYKNETITKKEMDQLKQKVYLKGSK